MKKLVRESEHLRILMPPSVRSVDRSSFLRGLGMSGLATLAACSSGGKLVLPNSAPNSNSLRYTKYGEQQLATTQTSLSFPSINGGVITAARQGNVMTVTGFDAAGNSLGSFTASSDPSGNVTWAGAGFDSPFTANVRSAPSTPVTILNHTISPLSANTPSINGPLITGGTGSISTTSSATSTTVTTSAGGNGVPMQSYSHEFLIPTITKPNPCHPVCLDTKHSFARQAHPYAVWDPTSWFFVGLGIVSIIIGIVAIIIALPLEVVIFGILCAILAVFWDICVQLG